MPKVIAIAGRALAGKDTFARLLMKADPAFSNIALADNLKVLCQIVFGLPPWLTDTQEGKMTQLVPSIEITKRDAWKIIQFMELTHKTQLCDKADNDFDFVMRQLPMTITSPRQLLQFVGTEICRALISTYHMDVLLRKISGPYATDRIWLVTDCRFPNERRGFVQQAQTKTVLIDRASAAAKTDTHASENGLGESSEYDFVINNNGTLEDLEDKAWGFAKLIREELK